MSETTAPEVTMSSAERQQLLAHLLKMRDRMAAEGHRHVAAWANDRLIELSDERQRQEDFLAAIEADL